jgi:transposase
MLNTVMIAHLSATKKDGIMAVSLPDARELSAEVLHALRLRAVRGCELGFTEADVADLLGLSRETVSRWWCAYAHGGLDTLPHERTGRPKGSGRTLTDQQANHIQQLLDANSPEALGIAAPLWSRRAVRDLIQKEYHIGMPVRTVGAYLKRWGYTAKRPRRHAKKQDPAEVRQWLEETYPAIEARAAQEFAEIHWCDETGVAADEYPRYGYARQGEPATMEVPAAPLRINVISTITNQGVLRFMTYMGAMNAALFLVFLTRLLRGATKKIFLIAERLSAHDAAMGADWLTSRTDRIEVFYLPRRAPELNVDEYLNHDLKENVHAAGLPNNKEEWRGRIQTFLRKLFHVPEHVMSYFQHSCVQYAAGL